MRRSLSPDTLVYELTPAGDPRISPDGRQILYTQSTTQRAPGKVTSQLWVCGIDGREPCRLTWSGEHNGGGRWSPDGRTIAFVSDRVVKSGIFVLPAEGSGEAREVTRHGQGISDLAWSPDGARLAYTALYDPENPEDKEREADAAPRVRVTRRLDYKQDNRGYLNDARLQVFVVDVATGERRRVSSAPYDYGFPQWSPDGRTLAAKKSNRNGMCSQLALLDVATGEERLVGPELGTVGQWVWSPSGDRLVLAADDAFIGGIRLDFFIHDLGTGATRRLSEDQPLLPDAGFPTIMPAAQPVWLDGRRVLFHAFRAGASVLAVLDTETGASEVVHAWTALHAGLSLDGARRYVVQSHASLEAVGEIAVFDRASGEGRIVSACNTALLRESPPAAWEKISVRRGEFTVEAWLLKPPDHDPSRRYPVVLDVHGGPHGYYGYTLNAVQQCLATNGFMVICTNPRGSASYGRHFAQQVIRDWGGEDYQDLLAVVEKVCERPDVDPARVGIYGYSYGGYMTAWAIGQSDRFKAAVCGAPCFDLESMYGTSDIGHAFCDLEYGGPPHENGDWYAAHSPSTYAHQTRTPTLIVHGEADDRCPIGQGEQMFVALCKAGCEVEFARYPGGSHLFLRVGPPEHRADMLERTLGWFKTHLGEPS